MKALFVAALFGLVGLIAGHGRLTNPAARNCMWRFGFKNPVNWNDDEQNCGSFGTQWDKNKGRCGVCGDAYNPGREPHNDGGKYANGIIAKTYKQGSTIEVDIQLTTGHWGYFEFRIGEFDNRKLEGDSMGKLKGHLLQLASGGTRFPVPHNKAEGKYKIKLVLPRGLTCKRCVMQWWYKAGNSWGCEKGKCGMGLGKQECFVNCADVSITA